jgi:O-antigen/teichoic acid export membrane protein
MARNRVVQNAGAATLQVVVSGAVMFGLYRYLIATIGVEQLGIWSVVLATTSASRITELGLTGSVVRFVAKYLANAEPRAAGEVVQTAVLSIGVFVGLVLCAAYYPAHWILAQVIPASALHAATELLPYAVMSLWVTTLGGVFQSALDGCQRSDLRSLFVTGNSLLTLITAMVLVPRFGLQGLAYAQLALSLVLATASWCCLKRELQELPAFPHRWNRSLFREMMRYGANFQIISLVTTSFDPVTKSLLSKFGNLSMVGYYEAASRMIMQLRSLLVSPNQVLVPLIAGLQETDSDQVRNMYVKSYRLQAFLSLPLYAGIFSVAPEISRLWIGSYQPTFVLYLLLLVAGWFLNSFVNPAYFSGLGTGKMRWNTLAHLLIAALNVVLGIGLGVAFGGTGVVFGWVIALVLGSSVVIVGFHHDNRIPLIEMFPRENLWLIVGSAAGIAASWAVYFRLQYGSAIIGTALICALAFLGAIAIPGWRHPMRAQLFGMISGR